ncbi:hypothetical protein Pcinc_025736 [Petrolisthes cinctipes]|uniref:Uncharacterized protein n=1 Tax=Petrolisthes cinctipes TaxID=88211 RepID=A0AAE1KBF0_PETCI|nr:hypothetical protein Pcinc_025736 [Petrolisthes cinctipes]
MYSNETLTTLPLIETARGSYESFDCAQAVALIAFIGLLSNFQDTIEEFTTLFNAGRSLRKKREGDNSPCGFLWAGLLEKVLDMKQWDADEKEDQVNNNNGEQLQQEPIDNNKEQDVDESTGRTSFESQPNTEGSPTILSSLAHVGPKLAMWVVDIGDGRVSGEAGRAGVCRATTTLTQQHGWLGSHAANLLVYVYVVVNKNILAKTTMNSDTLPLPFTTGRRWRVLWENTNPPKPGSLSLDSHPELQPAKHKKHHNKPDKRITWEENWCFS